MGNEGLTDIAEEIKHNNKFDEALQKQCTPQVYIPDSAKDAKSRKNLFYVFGVVALFFALGILFTFIRKEQVGTITDSTGHSIKGIIDERYNYNGFNFVKIDDVWNTELINNNRRLTIPLHYGPKDVENITIEGTLDSRFNNAKLVNIAFNPLDSNLTYVALANGELTLSLARAMYLNLKAACTQNETTPCAKQPILSCDSDQERAIIELRQANETSVQFKGNCILITGRDWELIKAVDRLLLRWYRIME